MRNPKVSGLQSQRERGKKSSLINRKPNDLDQESAKFSVNAGVSILSLYALWCLLQLFNLKGESSLNNMEISGCGRISIKLYVYKQATGQL